MTRTAALRPSAAEDEALKLYAAPRRVYPQRVTGTFRRMKWTLLVVMLGIYYFLPFLRWNRGGGEPGQAVLLDLGRGRFYFFFIELWPQDVTYIAGLMIAAALGLFLVNALVGRAWCGFACPQTVWTDLFLAVERWVEGDRRDRMRKAEAPLTAARIREILTKHAIWLVIAWWTGGAWVLYFADAPSLVVALATLKAPLAAYGAISVLTLTTYLLAGHMREQVCLYMCPWPRIQAAMTDEHAFNVTYRVDRGEPRQSLKKAEFLRSVGEPAGDCLDCNQCVAVCPTGVDIRTGADPGCIQCGLCIDACDAVMTKVGRPQRLIAYDTDVNLRRRAEGLAPVSRLVRPRTILYALMIAVIGGIMAGGLLLRPGSGLAVMHDRNPLFVRLRSGDIRNAYTVRLVNKAVEARRFTLSLAGLPGARLSIVGQSAAPDGSEGVEVAADQTWELRVLVTAPESAAHGSVPLSFAIRDEREPSGTLVQDYFRAP